MPIYRGNRIPFDASTIADLLAKGENVTPDPNEREMAVSTQRSLLMSELNRKPGGTQVIHKIITRGIWGNR